MIFFSTVSVTAVIKPQQKLCLLSFLRRRGTLALIKVVRLSDKSHDGAGFLSRIDGLYVMTDDTLIMSD